MMYVTGKVRQYAVPNAASFWLLESQCCAFILARDVAELASNPTHHTTHDNIASQQHDSNMTVLKSTSVIIIQKCNIVPMTSTMVCNVQHLWLLESQCCAFILARDVAELASNPTHHTTHDSIASQQHDSNMTILKSTSVIIIQKCNIVPMTSTMVCNVQHPNDKMMSQHCSAAWPLRNHNYACTRLQLCKQGIGAKATTSHQGPLHYIVHELHAVVRASMKAALKA